MYLGDVSNRNDRIFRSLLFVRWIFERDSVRESISQFYPGVDATREGNPGMVGECEFAT